MPEGDTLFRIAARLQPVLTGRCIVRAESQDCRLSTQSLQGHCVTAIEPRGKHLLIHVDNGLTLHTHLGMTGAWHVYALGEPWQKPRHRAAVTLFTDEAVCVCFSPKTLELLSADGLRRHAHLQHLGPDVLAPAFDAREALRRLSLHHTLPIGEALMDQTILCGVGNIYKSEILFHCRLYPWCPVTSLTTNELDAVLAAARKLMRANLATQTRRTRFRADGSRFWVYGRSGQPCFVCGQVIGMRHQGTLGRSTYWCPSCQMNPAAGPRTVVGEPTEL
jgi:endonuclease-8